MFRYLKHATRLEIPVGARFVAAARVLARSGFSFPTNPLPVPFLPVSRCRLVGAAAAGGMAAPRGKRPWLPGDDSSSDEDEAAARAAARARVPPSEHVDYTSDRFAPAVASVAAAPPPRDGGVAAAPPLDDSNLGFRMLRSLGYTPGAGVGKNEQGRTEPVAVVARAPRSGLGVDEAARERQRLAAAAALAAGEQQQRAAAATQQDFRARASAAHARRELTRRHRDACAALAALEGAEAAAPCDAAEDAEEPTEEELHEQLLRMCRCAHGRCASLLLLC